MITSPHDLAVTDEQLAEQVALRRASAQCLQAAREACAALYQRHAPRLLAFLAARVKRSDLEEIHQDIWVRVWERLAGSFQGGDFSGWLYQVARRYVIDCGRKKRPDNLADGADFIDDRAQAADDWLAHQERRDALQRCLARLPRTSAEVVQARLAGESYEELCPRLGLSPAQAHKLFHQAKANLRACLQRAIQ